MVAEVNNLGKTSFEALRKMAAKLLLIFLYASLFPESISSALLRSKQGLGSVTNHRTGWVTGQQL